MKILKVELNQTDYKVIEEKVKEQLSEYENLKLNVHAETFSFEFNTIPLLDVKCEIEFDFTFKGHYDDGEIWMSEPKLTIYCNGSELETTEIDYFNWLQGFNKEIEKELNDILF